MTNLENTPDIEEMIHKEFREMRRRGIKVKGWWLKFQGIEILDMRHPGLSFKFLDGWLAQFKFCYRINLTLLLVKLRILGVRYLYFYYYPHCFSAQ